MAKFQNVLQALHGVAQHRDGVTLSMVAVAWPSHKRA